jgi:putative membrane protein
MKKLITGASCVFLLMCMLSSCGSSGDSKDTAKDSVVRNDSVAALKPDSSGSANRTKKRVDNDASEFASRAAEGGMMEVELGQLANERAVSQRVKDFGAMMVKDHKAANAELRSVVGSLDISLPSMVSGGDKKEMDKLNKKNGKDFDKAYMNMMLDDHRKDVTEFRRAADKCSETSLRDFASKTLPVLEKHLDSAKAITGKH